MSVIDHVAARLLSLPDDDVTSEFIHTHLADSIVAWIAGRASLEGRELACEDALPLTGNDLTGKIALVVAQTRLTEVDDIHMPSCTTPGSVIVPVALTLAAETGADKATLNAAIRAGYEALCRCGLAIDGAHILYKGIWPTYFAAPFGAAAAAGRLLGLDADGMANALALALVQTSGAAGGPAKGRNARWLLAGWAAAAGVRAALAAARGFGGDRSLLDGTWCETTHGVKFHAAALTDGGGVMEHLSIKHACTAKQAAATLAAFQQVLASGTRAGDIARIDVHVPPAYLHMVGGQPPGRIGRIVSAKWQCALAALHPGELLDLERADHSGEPAFADFMGKITVKADDRLSQYFPHSYPARVEVERHDGKRATITVTEAPGDPGNRLSAQMHAEKLAALLYNAIGSAQGNALLAGLESLRSGHRSAQDLYAMITHRP